MVELKADRIRQRLDDSMRITVNLENCSNAEPNVNILPTEIISLSVIHTAIQCITEIPTMQKLLSIDDDIISC